MPKTPEEIAAEEAANAAAAQAAAQQAAAAKAAADAANGFPSDTAVADMKPEEQAAYWRAEAKKQQKKYEGMSDYEQRKADSEELARLKVANATEQEKAVEEARRQGENIGSERYLKAAVKSSFQALTGKTDEEVDTTFEHVDPKSFTDEKGEIVADKLKAFAATYGPKAPGGNQPDPVAAALARQRQAAGGSGSSPADKRKETRDKLLPPKA